MKPLLKWAGGKARLAPAICDAFEGRSPRRYFEPFIGSGAVFLYRQAQGHVTDALLGDANGKLVAFHIAIRDEADDVLDELSKMPCEGAWKAAYNTIRAQFNEGPWHGPRHAARLLWLNRAGFNGLYRENSKGVFNVPAGSYVKVGLPDEAHVYEVSAALACARIVTGDFAEVMKHAGWGDQVYCDPPYVPITQATNFTAYCQGEFGMAAQSRLASEACEAAARGATVVLSNHDMPIVRDQLYAAERGFEIHARPDVSRAISRSATGRKPVREVIARLRPRLRVA